MECESVFLINSLGLSGFLFFIVMCELENIKGSIS